MGVPVRGDQLGHGRVVGDARADGEHRLHERTPADDQRASRPRRARGVGPSRLARRQGVGGAREYHPSLPAAVQSGAKPHRACVVVSDQPLPEQPGVCRLRRLVHRWPRGLERHDRIRPTFDLPHPMASTYEIIQMRIIPITESNDVLSFTRGVIL